MRKLPILVVVGLVVAHISVDAQGRPSFAGTWMLVAERTIPADAMPLGPQVRIEQTSSALTISAPAMRLKLREGQSSVTPGGFTSSVYQLDGVQHFRPAPDAGPGISPQTESMSYRATWTEDQLVIMKGDAQRFTGDSTRPFVIYRTIRQALSLDASGNLVIDTLIVSEPFQTDLPVPVRAVYRKQP